MKRIKIFYDRSLVTSEFLMTLIFNSPGFSCTKLERIKSDEYCDDVCNSRDIAFLQSGDDRWFDLATTPFTVFTPSGDDEQILTPLGSPLQQVYISVDKNVQAWNSLFHVEIMKVERVELLEPLRVLFCERRSSEMVSSVVGSRFSFGQFRIEPCDFRHASLVITLDFFVEFRAFSQMFVGFFSIVGRRLLLF
jgi:hypothetical protein